MGHEGAILVSPVPSKQSPSPSYTAYRIINYDPIHDVTSLFCTIFGKIYDVNLGVERGALNIGSTSEVLSGANAADPAAPFGTT